MVPSSHPSPLCCSAAHAELTVSPADPWGNSCCLLPGVAPVPVFGSAGRSFQRRDHKRLLPPCPEPAPAPGQQLSPDRVPGAASLQVSILPSILYPLPAVPALRRLRRRLCLSREPLAVPPFSSSSPPSLCSHPPGGRQRLRNSPVEITDSSIFTR